MVAADTVSFVVLSTGILSPLNVDSSIALFPATMIPSTGILSPGRTMNISPGITFSTGIIFSV